MKARRTNAMTLIEVMIALSVMSIIFGVTYETIFQSMRFHKRLENDSVILANDCQVAEKLTADFATLAQLSSPAPASFLLKLRDGTTVEYDWANSNITRVVTLNGQHQQQTYQVGKSSVSFWNGITKSWTPQLTGPPPAALRLQIANSELILSEARR